MFVQNPKTILVVAQPQQLNTSRVDDGPTDAMAIENSR
jgi:hypothetical protein